MNEQPSPASTVVLLRDGMDGIETLLMRRVASMAFAPGMHVFPGGRVDERDHEATVTIIGGDVDELARRASTDAAGLRAFYSCAVRETLEEVGVALTDPTCDGSLVVDVTALPLIDHWVTPEREGRRYDVRFFGAMITGDDARLTTTEADHVAWRRPQDALAEADEGKVRLLPPTEAVLRWLATESSASAALMAGAHRPVVPLMPRLVEPGHWMLVHAYTGEVLRDPVPGPHTREDNGQPREDA